MNSTEKETEAGYFDDNSSPNNEKKGEKKRVTLLFELY